MLTVSATELGTPEEAWLGCAALHGLAPMEWSGSGGVVLVAPHPDDEVLALGGTLLALARAGRELTIVAVTDGEASHPRSRALSRSEMAMKRAAERAEALGRLGVPRVKVLRLRCPDGAVSEHVLQERLAPLLEGAELCLATWSRDGHPDHEATGRAAAAACAAARVTLVEYPVWAWHWARPDSDDFPWERARVVRLEDDVRAIKRVAIAAYRSQIAPLGEAEADAAVLPPAVLARFHRAFEVVFV